MPWEDMSWRALSLAMTRGVFDCDPLVNIQKKIKKTI